jgi:tetratricopeptide (TPR) repeat protein
MGAGGGPRASTLPVRGNIGGTGAVARPATNFQTGINNRPGGGNRPGLGDRPEIGNRPGTGDRGDRINNRHDHWQNVHNDWYHGYWTGHWGYGAGYQHPWAAWAIGLTSWSAGSIFYDTGYDEFANPYWDSTAVVESSAIDYTQPIVTTTALPDANASASMIAVTESERARTAFSSGDYATALEFVDRALSSTPSDVALHELRALCLFALHRYKDAAGTLYAVLSVGPGWDWTTISSLYSDAAVYTQQLRALEDYVRQNPESSEGPFVLAYHYMTQGHLDAADRQLKEVSRLVPNDQVSRQLLAMIAPPEAGSSAGAPSTTEPEPKRTPPSSVVGTWKAPAKSGGTVDLSLRADDRFTWKYAHQKKTQSFDGKYELAGTTLVLEYSNGGTMVGRVDADRQDRFSFKMVGGPANDPGLVFSK